MNHKNEHLIVDYLEKELSPTERKKFEKELESSSELQALTDEYKDLLTQLNLLKKATAFRKKLQQWNAKHDKDNDEIVFIEQWTKGESHPSTDSAIKEKAAQDPSFKEKVEQHQQFLSGVQGLKNDQFRDKLKKWESKHTTTTPLSNTKPKAKTIKLSKIISIAASFALIVMIASFMMQKQQYSNHELAKAALVDAPPVGHTMGGENHEATTTTIDKKVFLADEYVKAAKYKLAKKELEEILVLLEKEEMQQPLKKTIRNYAEWTIIISDLNLGVDDATIVKEIDVFQQQKLSANYEKKAEILKTKLQSIYRKW